MAGYIVEQVSGVPFNDYVERNIFQRLGMAHSTFQQPLPPNLAPAMSRGYRTASQDARPFELISIPPAGGATISGDDMAAYMIAMLNQGEGLMRPETAAQMMDPTTVTLSRTEPHGAWVL